MGAVARRPASGPSDLLTGVAGPCYPNRRFGHAARARAAGTDGSSDGDPMDERYDPHSVEERAQRYWREHDSFRATEDPKREKFYCLSMFPYPSGHMHMGHVRAYTLGDVIARFQRMQGRNVLQPMGWDAFGLPAENAAIDNRVPPAEWTYANIDAMRRQFKRLGWAFDWERELATCDPEYYRWEQWLFTRLYDKGLVYRHSAVVNWDPVDQTVLANEQVENGRGWRSGALIERREMPQWYLKITAYADELLDSLYAMDGWPDQVRAMQRNWIGRSEGVDIEFEVIGRDTPLSVFTTRPDTLLGCTYMALAPDHPLACEVAARDPDVGAFVEQCRHMSTAESEVATLEKRGIATGLEAKHPITGASVPIWVANFVLMEYGSGAVMCVPGHDGRDWEFARAYGLPIVQVIEPDPEVSGDVACDLEQGAFEAPGRLIHSREYDGLTSAQAFDAIAARLERDGHGRRRTNYRLRDWCVSRQRYWGCPIPIIHCEACGPVPVPDADLPVVLPTDVRFEGIASPLKTEAFADWRRVDCPRCGAQAERETDTFDTFMESSWYFDRFTCSDDAEAMLDERVDYWMPVEHYVGGIEHAVLHLLYARFLHKLLRDEGLVASDEPFERLLLLGMVLKDGKKMSKSAGNVVTPQELVERHGADAVRTFMMFAAPPEQTLEWSESGVEGAVRFLRRLWRLVAEHRPEAPAPVLDPAALDSGQRELRRKVHATLMKARDDYARRQAFNTVVSGVMELVNELVRFEDGSEQGRAVVREALEVAVRVLAPIAPHICHELWAAFGHAEAVIDTPWPAADPAALERDAVELVVQVNGKVRGRVEVPAGADEDTARDAALALDNVRRFTDGKRLRKAVLVPDKLLNLVVR